MMSRRKFVSLKQLEVLVEFIEKHKEIVLTRLSRESRPKWLKVWNKLAIQLNSVSTGCVTKTVADWRKWFADYKHKLVCKKRTLLTNGSVLPTGQTAAPLGPLEERLCVILFADETRPPLAGRSDTPEEEIDEVNPLPDGENSSYSEDFNGFMQQAFGEEVVIDGITNDASGEKMVIPFKEEVEETNNLRLIVTRAAATNNLDQNQTRISPEPQPSTSSGHPYRPAQRQKRSRLTSNRRKRKKDEEVKNEDINLGESAADENKSALEESRQMLIRLEAKRCKTNRYLADGMKQMAESLSLVAGSFATVAQSLRDLTTEVRNSYRNNRSQSRHRQNNRSRSRHRQNKRNRSGRRHHDLSSFSSSSSEL